jgi:hypothetical protein
MLDLLVLGLTAEVPHRGTSEEGRLSRPPMDYRMPACKPEALVWALLSSMTMPSSVGKSSICCTRLKLSIFRDEPIERSVAHETAGYAIPIDTRAGGGFRPGESWGMLHLSFA